MIYVLSDIHGCYDKYRKMLEKIKFRNRDILYVLGDVVDRGPNGMKVLLDIAERKNVVFLRGNHDHQARFFLENLYMLETDKCSRDFVEQFQLWVDDGGKATLEEFLNLNEEEMKTVLRELNNSLISKSIQVEKKKYHLSHTVSSTERICDFDEWTLDDFIMGEPDYDEIYFDDEYVVTGHTPTGYIDGRYKGKIWMGNNHIALDCGAVFGNPLGCLCLDTYEEFYVK